MRTDLSQTEEQTPEKPLSATPAVSHLGSAADYVLEENDSCAPRTLIRWETSDRRRRRKQSIGVEYDGEFLILTGTSLVGNTRSIDRLWVTVWPSTPKPEQLAGVLQSFAPEKRPRVDIVITTSRAMVRLYHIPSVPRRRRHAAARWEGQKLVPFPLNEAETLFGMEYERDDKNGWWVTLVAIPRSDAASIMAATQSLGWNPHSISLGGSQCDMETSLYESPEEDSETKAIVMWSTHRATFSVFQGDRLKFHYDLGTIPEPPVGAPDDSQAHREEALHGWIEIVASLLADPFDFCLNARPGTTPTRVELVGFTDAIAPLITDWEDRFGASFSVTNPVRDMQQLLPEEVATWVTDQAGMIAPSALAASDAKIIDCTPSPVRRARHRNQLTRVARTAFVLSTVGVAVWIGLLANHLRLDRSAVVTAREDLAQFEMIAPITQLRTQLAQEAAARGRLATLDRSRQRWMPWLKTAVGSVPKNARLTSVSLQAPPDDAPSKSGTLVFRLDGTLSPDGPPHPLIYRKWIDELAGLSGDRQTPQLQARDIVWKGRVRSAFSIEMEPQSAAVTGAGR